MFASLASLPAQGAVLLLTAGLAAIAWELNRPGFILPGALGVLCVLFAVASLGRLSLHLWAALLLLAATAVLACNLAWRLPLLLLGAAGVAFILGLRWLVSGTPGVGWPVAVACGATLGMGAAVLSRIALRARRAKQVD